MKKHLKKVIRLLDRITTWGEIILCLFLILLASYCLYDIKMLLDGASDSSLLRYKPGYGETEVDGRELLKDKYVGWLTIEGTGIDYPVMQGDTNDEFINTDPYGEFSLSGSIFLDYRNSREIKDEYNLIYGHHMEYGHLFGALDKYREEKFFLSHRDGTLTTERGAYAYRIYAVLETDATQDEIFAPTEIEKTEVVRYIEETSAFFDEEFLVYSKDNPILALSTCQTPSSLRRTVVVGTLKGSPGMAVKMGSGYS